MYCNRVLYHNSYTIIAGYGRPRTFQFTATIPHVHNYIILANAVHYKYQRCSEVCLWSTNSLDEFTWEWNHHRIRRSNMSEVPHGIPDVLYSVPSLNESFCDSPYNIIIVL